jgi:hypothetical protein
MRSTESVDVPTRPIVGDAATITGCTETYESLAVAQATVQMSVSLSLAERPVSAGAVKPQQDSALAAPHEDEWVTAAVVLASPAGSDSLAHCDDQLVVPHTWVVDGEPGAAVGSGVGRVTPENVAGCGEQTTVFVGYAWASTRAPVHKPARKSRSPPRASMHVEALVMTALQDDLADWTGKRRGSRTSLTVAANAKKRRTGSVDGRPRLQYAVRKPRNGENGGRC